MFITLLINPTLAHQALGFSRPAALKLLFGNIGSDRTGKLREHIPKTRLASPRGALRSQYAAALLVVLPW